jgi:SAM-dependent methyltransferase
VTEQPLPEHVLVNRAQWDEDAPNWVADGERLWQSEPSWGMWGVPIPGLLPDDMSGMDAIELGCGTGYVSAWMARRGATVVGIDNSEGQLATARRLAAEHDVALTLIHGNAETVPYPDESFDFAISEYGAAIWCDPYVWIPEAHRLLRPGGTLVFLGTSTLATLCSPVDGSVPTTERLERDYFSIYRLDWRDAVDEPGGIEFNLPISGWFRLFRETGFDVVDFIEVQAPEPTPGSEEVRFFASAEWAHRFPSEQVWVLRKRGAPR